MAENAVKIDFLAENHSAAYTDFQKKSVIIEEMNT